MHLETNGRFPLRTLFFARPSGGEVLEGPKRQSVMHFPFQVTFAFAVRRPLEGKKQF